MSTKATESTKSSPEIIRFKERLAQVKPHLPTHYALLISIALPEKKKQRIYNVYHYGVCDWDVLAEMEKIAGK